MISAIVEPPLLDWMLVRTFVRMSFAGPGATDPRLSSRGWVAEGPITPSTETSASSIGNSERIPKYVSAAAQVVSLSSPNCLNVRLRIVGQESLGMSVGCSGESSRAPPPLGERVRLDAAWAMGPRYPQPPYSTTTGCTGAPVP
jgi:hypothetical protein